MGIRRALTVGEIARQLGCPIHRVEYLIRSRKLKHFERAGNLRVFSVDVLEQLRDEVGRREREIAHAS